MPTSRSTKPRRDQRIVVVAIESHSTFGRSLVRGIMKVLNTRPQWLVFEQLEPSLANIPRWPRGDAAIISVSEPVLLAGIRKRYPIVINFSGNTDERDLFVVCSDPLATGKLAADHFADRGVRNFAFCGWKGQLLSQRRFQCFRRAVHNLGAHCAEAWIDPDSPEFGALGAVRKTDAFAWLHQLPKPVGILSVDDNAARKLAALCAASNIRVPDDVLLLGINNDDVQCEICTPPLSSIDPDFERIGAMAATRLDLLLQRPDAKPEVVLVPPKCVVPRLSTDVLAVADPMLASAMRYIQQHACEPCTVKDVLREVPANRRWLERQFVEVLGRSPHESIVQVRMLRAQHLLLDTSCSIHEIALRCGYSSARNFIAAFSRHLGQTPALFRRNRASTDAKISSIDQKVKICHKQVKSRR